MTMPNDALRNRYLADAVATASPARLLVMLYDRLVLDLARGEQALRDGDRGAASQQLLHAQDIVLELRASLDTDAWEGGPGLARLYEFVMTELIQANVRRDADRVAGCRALMEPLRDAWREAAATTAASAA
ncbi:flagellar protein FliS [Pilimelia anulata]|uniref:Flagellar protein FliS n=1 Tax=Pilimelia anulata TaxID=53371 RepID=A0A8J3B0V9_9ACTN|nr:flagellar export chaperone FliS [Pilimelia anulata]GGJ82576.1 flagellar protein FliS [Pilimelia anulata]